MSNHYSDYDGFAWIYNRYWGEGFTTAALPVLDELVLKHLPADAHILDVGCGTGQLAHLLTERGYRVTGLDGSEGMLQFARENAPRATFIHEDARTFDLPEQYHAAWSLYDALNHIMSLDEMQSVFRNMYRALLPGGYICFDLNMEAGYLARWNNQSFAQTADDHAFIVQSQYDQASQVAEMKITTFFQKDGACYERSAVTLTQHAYPVRDIKSALEAVGFQKIAFYHATPNGLRLGESGRTFFIGQK